ncbi:MAG: ABC transporter ATP-binding protein [Pseudomonadota bacterium]
MARRHADNRRTAPSDPDMAAALRILRPHLGPALGPLTFSIVAAVAYTLLELAPIWVTLWLVTLTVRAEAAPGDFVAGAVLLAVTIPLCYTLYGLSTEKSHVAAFRMIRSLRLRIAEHLTHLPLGQVTDLSSGASRKLMIDEPEKLELVVAHALPEGVGAVLMWMVVTVWLFATDWLMALATVLLVPVALLAMGLAIRRSVPNMAAFQDANLHMNGVLAEFLRGITAIKVYHRAGPAIARTATAIRDFAQLQSDWGRQFVPLGGTFYALILANITVILPVGLWSLHAGWIDLTEFLLFVILGGNYGAPLMRLFNLFGQMAHISVAVTNIDHVLSSQRQPDTGADLPLRGHEVRFDAVSFGYGEDGDTAALRDVSFTAPGAGMTALIGPSGAGKSTVAALLARFYDPWSGRITIGGQDIAAMGQTQLMETVSFVFQDTFLFRGTIAEALRFARQDASHADLEAAARAARAYDFITALPDGFDTMIGDGSGILSGGERQRLAIARAILKDAPVLVLDEATAFADPDNEAEIQKAISALARGKTVVVVAHRLHTITRADRIIVLDGGRCVAQGRHEELIAQDGLYARMWRDYSATRSARLQTTAPAQEAV